MCGQAPSSRRGEHTQVLAPGPQAKGWAEASPSPPWSLGLALATSLHGLPVPKCAKFSPTPRPLPKVTQRVTKPGLRPSSAQLQSHDIWRISKDSRAPAPPRARGPPPHGQVAAASQGVIAPSPPKRSSLACSWPRPTFKGTKCIHSAEKDWVSFLLPRSPNLGRAPRSLAALLLLPVV